MTTTISRMYPTKEQAANAAAALTEEGLPDVHMVTGEECAGMSMDDIVTRICKGMVLKAKAKVYAQGIAKGNSLVTIHALFGLAKLAEDIMAKYGPIDSGIPDPAVDDKLIVWDDAAPLSSMLQWPVAYRNSTPFASFWSLPKLASHDYSFSTKMKFSLLSREPAPFSKLMNMQLLSGDPAPLSSLIKMPTLQKK